MFGMGLPELVIIIGLYAIVILVFYRIIRAAVKGGILDAHEKIKKAELEREQTESTLP